MLHTVPALLQILLKNVDNSDVNAVSAYREGKKQQQQPANKQPKKKQCIKCSAHNHSRKYCTVTNVHCDFCNMDSHSTVACFKKKNADQGKNGTNASTPTAVKTNTVQTRKLWCFQRSSGNMQPMITLLGQHAGSPNNSVYEINALADTRAEQCIMDKACFKAVTTKEIRLDRSNTFLSQMAQAPKLLVKLNSDSE